MSDGLTNPPSAGLTRHSGTLTLLLPVLAFLTGIITVKHDPVPPFLTGDHSPYGYTISLGLFLVPLTSLTVWFARKKAVLECQWQAFWIVTAMVATTWSLLDIFLGNAFFTFPNRGATLQIFAPGYTFGRGWTYSIPIEEFVFYISGSAAILLGYIWAAESWLAKYTKTPAEFDAYVQTVPKLVTVRPRYLVQGAILFAIVLAWKKLGWHEHTAGFPSYFLFELLMVIVPAATLSDAVRPVVNQPAFVYKTLALVLTSLLWEATLALPYGWWGFHHENMMGILIRPWFNLPVEEVVLWPSAAWLNLTLYESIRIYLRSGRPLMDLLFNPRPQPIPAQYRQ